MKSTSACKTNLLNNANVILRMGGFHIAQTFFGAIGHLMQGTGIVDIMVEVNARLCGTAAKIISEKEYYAMLRDHTKVQKYMFPSSNNLKVMLVDAMRFIQNYQHHGSSTFHELKDKYIKLHLSIIIYHITANAFTLLVIDMM